MRVNSMFKIIITTSSLSFDLPKLFFYIWNDVEKNKITNIKKL